MCEWCGEDKTIDRLGAGEQFCSLQCRTRYEAFRVRHVLDNWRALPLERRAQWIRNAATSAWPDLRGVIRKVSGGRHVVAEGALGKVPQKAALQLDTRVLPPEVATNAGHSVEDGAVRAQAWAGDGIVEILDSPMRD